jgi:ArsR family transcriptional regulator
LMNTNFDVRKIERISKALGDPYRIKMMEAIKKEQNWLQCSCLVDMFKLAQSTVSHHLKQLVDADLIIMEKEGRATKYVVNKEVFDDYVNYLKQFCADK